MVLIVLEPKEGAGEIKLKKRIEQNAAEEQQQWSGVNCFLQMSQTLLQQNCSLANFPHAPTCSHPPHLLAPTGALIVTVV